MGLRKMVASYLSDRRIVVPDRKMRHVTGGVLLGSVLGPYLWNIFYNTVLRMRRGEGIETIAYADNLAIITRAKTIPQLLDRAKYAALSTIEHLREMGLTVASEKTEIVLLAGIWTCMLTGTYDIPRMYRKLLTRQSGCPMYW